MDTTLEMQLKTTGQETLKIFKELNTAMTGLVTTLNKVQGATSSIETLGKKSEKTLGKVDKLSTSFNKLFSTIAAKKIGVKAFEFLTQASDRAEELNLFNVIFKNIKKNGEQTFSDLGLAATKFQNKINEAFGTNMTETMRYQGLYQAMATNQGIDSKHAAIMSENMVKLTYDLASLYNASEQKTAEALRSGVFTGQVKPLRSFGVNVTEKSLNPVLQNLGITDRTVSDMSQAEKQILRYIATLNQSRAAMGDFADTIESPANQLKIFKQQLVEAKVAIGNLFMGVYSEVLPYANAFLMVVKEVAKAIADLLGIQAGDYNSGLASQEDVYNGIADGAGKAAKANKELKRQLLKFDEVNNITTPKKNSNGSGSGLGSSGIDKRLLDAISGYDNLMDKVRMKANQIRDRWMEILGFKKEINPLTGEMEWKYQGIGTTIKNLVGEFGDLNAKAQLFVGIGLYAALSKIFSVIKKLGSKVGLGGILTSSKNLITALSMAKGGTGTLTENLGASIEMWREQQGIIGKNTSALQKYWNGLKEFTKGLTVAATSFTVMNIGLENMADNGLTAFNALETLGGGIGTIFGAIQAGAVFGEWGAIIGGTVGAITVLVEAIEGIDTALDSNKQNFKRLRKEIDDGYKEWEKSAQNIEEAFSKTDSTWDYYSQLNDQLTLMVDGNGKVKEGYEDRVEFITGELSRALGYEIEMNGNVIKNYKEVEKEIVKLIEQKKAMAKLNALEKEYNEALEQRGPAEDRKREAYQQMINAQKDLKKSLKDTAEQYGLTTDELYNYLVKGEQSAKIQEILNDKYSDANVNLRILGVAYQNQISDVKDTAKLYEDASNELSKWNSTIDTWDKMYGLALKGKYKEINDYATHTRNVIGKDLNQRTEYWEKVVHDQQLNLEMLELDRKNMSVEAYNARKKEFEKELKLAESELEELNLIVRTKNGDLSKDTLDTWKKIGNKSVEEFKTAFSELPDDVKKKLIDGLEKNKKSLSKELQDYFNKIKPTLTVDTMVNKSNVKKQIRELLIAANLPVPTLFKELGGIYNGSSWRDIPQYANGGVPSHGTLFTAGENGAEIVGNINRRTEVLNRSQIASAIYSAVASAMSQYGGGTTQVELIAHTDEGVVIDRINQKTKQTGRCPINIPSY